MVATGPPQWDNKIEYILSVVGFAVGMGNMVRFPFTALKNGGGAFLLPYIVVLGVIAYPLMVLESALGQFTSRGPIESFKDGIPLLGGIGYAMMGVSAWITCYYNVILAWIIYYCYLSLFPDPVFNKCPEELKGISCIDDLQEIQAANEKLKQLELSKDPTANYTACYQMPQGVYYDQYVLGQSVKPCAVDNANYTTQLQAWEDERNAHHGNIFDMGNFQWPLVFCHLFSYIVLAFACRTGIKSSGKAMYVMMIFPAITLIGLLIRGLFLEGAWLGLTKFFTPDFSRLTEISIWIKATEQVFFSIGVAWGGLVTLASYNKFDNNVIADTRTILFADTMVSILSGATVFVYLGEYSLQSGTKLEEVEGGYGLIFKVFPYALKLCFEHSAWLLMAANFIFFVDLWFMGMSSMSGLSKSFTRLLFNTCAQCMEEMFSSLKGKLSTAQPLMIFGFFLVGLPMCQQYGMDLLLTCDGVVNGVVLILIATIELFGMAYIYGAERMMNDIRQMMGERFPRIMTKLIYFWKYITPGLYCLFLLNNIIQAIRGEKNSHQESGKEETFENTGNGKWLVTLLMLVSTFSAFFTESYSALKRYGFKASLKPTNRFGPLDPVEGGKREHFRNDGLSYSSNDVSENEKIYADFQQDAC